MFKGNVFRIMTTFQHKMSIIIVRAHEADTLYLCAAIKSNTARNCEHTNTSANIAATAAGADDDGDAVMMMIKMKIKARHRLFLLLTTKMCTHTRCIWIIMLLLCNNGIT